MSFADDLLARLLEDVDALVRRQAEADRLIASSSAAHLVQELAGQARNRPWRLDPIPFVLEADEFDRLADAVAERLRGFEELLADLYGPRRVVRDGVVPAEALASSSRYRLGSVGSPAPRRWLSTYAVDVVRLADGTWRIVQDFTDTPTGVGYALLDRLVMARVAGEVLGDHRAGDLASISGFPAEIRHALVATTDAPSPRVVLFTGGVDDPAYVEHAALARQLGFNLVERADLVVRRSRLWLRTLGGLDPIDVVYRRVDDGALDPVEVLARSHGGVPGLLAAVGEGGVAVANAHGAGVVEDEKLAGYWPDAVEALVGHRPPLARLVDGEELDARAVLHDGQPGRAATVLRLHAVAGADGITVMTGGNGRVLGPGDDDPRHPRAHVAKDVWVMVGHHRTPVIVAPHLPQVDLAMSVPTRAADALYSMGRASERAEGIARTARVIAGRRQQDPSLVTLADGRWARRMAAALRATREPDDHEVLATGERPAAELHRELAAAVRRLGEQIGVLVAEAASVGEFMSGTSSRVLNRLAKLPRTLAAGRGPIDVLDDVLEQLAALAGLWAESTVRGPAWWFGDLGRRLERGRVVLALVDACAVDVPAGVEPDAADSASLDVLLASNESLVAYRRRHRSDVELGPALELLLDDEDNPRSMASCWARIGAAVEALGWADGRRFVADHDGIRPSVATLDELAELIDATWFATPVDPVAMRGEVIG